MFVKLIAAALLDVPLLERGAHALDREAVDAEELDEAAVHAAEVHLQGPEDALDGGLIDVLADEREEATTVLGGSSRTPPARVGLPQVGLRLRAGAAEGRRAVLLEKLEEKDYKRLLTE